MMVLIFLIKKFFFNNSLFFLKNIDLKNIYIIIKILNIIKLIGYFFIDLNENEDCIINNIGPNPNNNNNNIGPNIPPHIRWYIMYRLSREFIYFMRHMEHLNTTDHTVLSLLMCSFLLFGIYIVSQKNAEEEENINDDINDDINNIE
jgi:hypothetical protein